MDGQNPGLVRTVQDLGGGVVAVDDALLIEQQMGIGGLLEEDAEFFIGGLPVGDIFRDVGETRIAIGRRPTKLTVTLIQRLPSLLSEVYSKRTGWLVVSLRR
jgi:hypothetical protein